MTSNSKVIFAPIATLEEGKVLKVEKLSKTIPLDLLRDKVANHLLNLIQGKKLSSGDSLTIEGGFTATQESGVKDIAQKFGHDQKIKISVRVPLPVGAKR